MKSNRQKPLPCSDVIGGTVAKGAGLRGRPCTYHFNELEVGQGFLIVCEPGPQATVGTLGYWHKKFPERRFSRRATVRNGISGYWISRVR